MVVVAVSFRVLLVRVLLRTLLTMELRVLWCPRQDMSIRSQSQEIVVLLLSY